VPGLCNCGNRTPRGSKNKRANAQKEVLSKLAEPHGPKVIRQLVGLAMTADSEAVRVRHSAPV
jgi:hypothetical protein